MKTALSACDWCWNQISSLASHHFHFNRRPYICYYEVFSDSLVFPEPHLCWTLSASCSTPHQVTSPLTICQSNCSYKHTQVSTCTCAEWPIAETAEQITSALTICQWSMSEIDRVIIGVEVEQATGGGHTAGRGSSSSSSHTWWLASCWHVVAAYWLYRFDEAAATGNSSISLMLSCQ